MWVSLGGSSSGTPACERVCFEQEQGEKRQELSIVGATGASRPTFARITSCLRGWGSLLGSSIRVSAHPALPGLPPSPSATGWQGFAASYIYCHLGDFDL